MKVFLLLFLVFISCLGLNLLQDKDIIEINLKEEISRKEYSINFNKIYKFINAKDIYIYFIEIKNNTEIINEKNQTIRDITFLTPNDYIFMGVKNDTLDEKKVYVTSISNNINIFRFNSTNGKITGTLPRNTITLLYSEDDEEKILNMESFEKVHSFYYYKYDYNNITPKDFNPINKSLFIKSNNTIITLNKGSIYIIFTEIYKLDFIINSYEFFIFSKQVDMDVKPEHDSFYLKHSNDFYNISFPKSGEKRILQLSKKTNDSIVIDLNDNIVLSGNNLYYELTEDNINSGIQLKVLNNDCLIRILYSSKDNSEILEGYSKENYKVFKAYTIIKIPKIKTKYQLIFSSKNEKNITNFNFGIMNIISKNSYFCNKTIEIKQIIGQGKFYLTIDLPYLYNTEIQKDEYQICEIYFSEEQLKNDIYLSYNPVSFYNYLLKPIDDKKSEYIIGNISSILDKFYIYKDIAKNPPKFKTFENYHHDPIDLIFTMKNIRKTNQTYLSLYQDIYRVLKSVRDDHLNIQLKTLENEFDISNKGLCLPFEFYIEMDKTGKAILKVKLHNSCVNNYPNKNLVDNFIISHADIPIKSINKTNPFEYIQNFGKYQRYKSKHAQFSINLFRVYGFSIPQIPYDYLDLINIEYEFENGDIFCYDYITATFSSFTDLDQKEFEEFYQSLINNQKNDKIIPNIFDARKLFMKKKGILKEDKKINWDLQTADEKLKCRVDKENKYNVFLQTSFSFKTLSNSNVIDIMIKCSELFYSNEYKIIGIENYNNGGTAKLFEFWHQLLQQKTLHKTYQALIYNEKAFKFMKETDFYSDLINVETCKFMGSLEELGLKNDDYGYSSEFKQNIFHNRTNMYEFLDRNQKKALDKLRKKKFENKNFLKKPTDILIYTDSFCYSAGSNFIKAFQKTGGAIIVGFNGNPKLDINEFDASQSPSSVHGFRDEEYDNLQSLGYNIIGITYAEAFDDSYQNPNPIPMEYVIDLVDERVPIYAPYSDDLYNDFIDKANFIFKKYETNCSKNNPKLLLDDENCKFNDKRKGGHPCGEDGKWDMSKCEAYYCEFGYYYDQIKKKCVLDICTNGNEIDIYLDNEKIYNSTKEYFIDPDKEIVFHLQDESYIYLFETNMNNDNLFSSYNPQGLYIHNESNFYIFTFNKKEFFDFEVNVNYYKTLKEKTKIKISTIKKQSNISIINQNIFFDNPISDGFIRLEQKNLFFNLIESKKKDYVIYTFTFNKNAWIYYPVKNQDLKIQDIININKNKFHSVSQKIIEIKKNDIGLLVYQTPHNYYFSIIFASPKELEQDIIISNDRFMYLSKKDFIYNLNKNSVSKNIYLKLNSETLDSEIEILDDKNSKINRNNRYYFVDKNIKNLSLKLKNDNSALIELLYEYEFTNDNILDINQKKFELNEGFYFLKYKKSDKIKSLQIDVLSKDILNGYIFPTIGKENFAGIFPRVENVGQNHINSEFIFPEYNIDKTEDFVIFIKMNSKFNLKVEVSKENKGNDDINDNKFPVWVIILIIVIIMIIILGTVYIMVIIYKKREINIDINDKEALLEENN